MVSVGLVYGCLASYTGQNIMAAEGFDRENRSVHDPPGSRDLISKWPGITPLKDLAPVTAMPHLLKFPGIPKMALPAGDQVFKTEDFHIQLLTLLGIINIVGHCFLVIFCQLYGQ